MIKATKESIEDEDKIYEAEMKGIEECKRMLEEKKQELLKRKQDYDKE
jgi:hypothetical protein